MDLQHVYEGPVPDAGRHSSSNVACFACYGLRRGALRVSINGARYDLAVGEWIVLPPSQLRRQDFSDDAELCSINMLVAWGDGRPLFDCPQGLKLRNEAAERMDTAAAQLLPVCRPLYGLEDGRIVRHAIDTGHWLASRAGFLAFVARWYDLLVGEGLRPSGDQPDDERLATALQLLQPEEVGRCVPHELLRARCGLSRAQLDRLFKARFGRSPKRLLEERCLARAQELLRDPALPIKALAARLGFTDSAHFGRWFKQASGRTPKAYRRAPDV